MYRRFVTTLVLSIIFGVVCCASVYAAVVTGGDGNLLRRTNQGDDTCGGPTNACHNLQVHNATNTGSTYWSSNWGLTGGKYGKFVCQTCHTPHNTQNIYLIREKIKFPDGTTMPSLLTESTVDFRYKSGTPGSAPYAMGDDSDSHTTSTRPCEVCHSQTKHHRYSTSAQTDGKGHNNAVDCNNCHKHEKGFIKLGEGGAECGACHSTITDPMLGNVVGNVDGTSQYHMVMQNVDITAITGGIGTSNKYPAESQPAASPSLSTHRRCLMCHAEMENFSPLKNPGTPGRAYNLRKSITSAPSNQTDISQLANTDYDKGASSGVCTSCHQYQQTKDTVKQTTADNTTYTPVINPGLFANSPHNYTVDVTNAFIDTSTFQANCVKCHNDTLTKEKQTGAYQFGVHASTVRRLNAVTNANETSASPTYNKTNYGTATGGTTTTVVDTNKNWTTNMWTNRPVSILSGTGSGQTRWVSSNTSNTLTITTLTTAPSTDSVYLIGDSRGVDSGTSTGSNTTTTLNDTTKTTAWKTNYWKNRLITIVSGTGIGQTRKIVSNTTTALTIDTNWNTTPGTTSKYSIGDPMEEDFCFKCHSMTNPNAATKKDYYGAATIVNGKMLKMEDMFMTYTGTGGAGNNADTTNCPAATYPTSTSLVITPSPAWNTGKWAGYAIRITSGSGVGEIKKITGSGASFLCLDKDWTTVPAAASTYEIGQIRHRIDAYSGVHRTDEAINAPTNLTTAGWFNYGGTGNPGVHNGCTDCHNPHAQKKPGEDYGTATSGAATTITDTNKAWTQDLWRGYNLRLMDGTGAGQDRMITSNSATALYVGGGAASGGFATAPTTGTYYIIVPTGLPDKGNNLAGQNNGQWGVDVTPAGYPTPAVGSYSNPTFAKNTSLVSGSDKIYELCFKCHSDYGWGNNGTSFNIVDATSATLNVYQTTASTNVAREFNPHNVGYHPVVDTGANQPITAMGGNPQNIGGPFTASAGAATSVSVSTAQTWVPTGNCVEITSGTGAGQIRGAAGYTTTSITVDPAFTTAPVAGSVFYIRKCSIFNNGSPYDPLTAPWPRFTLGTVALNTAGTATISGLSNGIPSTVIPGWYLYAGTLYSAVNNNVMPNVGACSATAPCPPMLATSGWYQVTGISANASGTGTTSVTLNITPPPPTNSSGNNYALTAGLGNNFIPPYGPWSVIACTDCHDTDSPTDPSGPHGSARPWILRQLEAQSFPWFIGGINATTSTSPTTPNSATYLITVGYPDGSTAWPNVGTANGNPMPNYMCLNCHRADVYGYEDSSPKDQTAPTGTGFTNFAWRFMSRLPHIPDGSSGHPSDSDGSANATNSYGIMCLNCHGGDARVNVGTDPANQALGGIHGSNLGTGKDATSVTIGASYRGRRLLNGAIWVGVTRATTSAAVACWNKQGSSFPTTDGVSSCSHSHAGDAGRLANYPYYSGSD